MPLLDVKVTKSVTITCKVEESTAKLVDLYAEFTGGSADVVIDLALNHVFKLDKEFQKYIAEHGDVKAEPSLRVKKEAAAAPKGSKAPRKPQLAIAQ